MNKEQMQEFVELCKRPEIQKHFQSPYKYNYCLKCECKLTQLISEKVCDKNFHGKHWIYLPNSDQLIEILGDNGRNILLDITKGEGCGISVCNKFGKLIFATTEDDYKTALAKAVIAVEGEK